MVDESILESVARATRLREGPPGVLAVLRAVYRAGSLRLQDVARQARLPLPVATAIRRELEKLDFLERKHGLSLTEKGRTFVEHELGLGLKTDVTCPTCAGRGVVVPPDFHALIRRLSEITASAPSADVTLDQAPCTPETAMLRALVMLQNGALEGRRVLLLGDDDSVSIAIGLLGRSLGHDDLTRGVVVADVDDRFLSFISAAAKKEQIRIDTVHHDLRDPLPDALTDSFDTIETDPPYTFEGARLFLARGREALSLEGSGVCFFSFAQWPAPQMLELQELFVAFGWAIRNVWPNFNRYAGATVLGNAGQLIELHRGKVVASDLPTWSGPLYTADVNPRSRAYICAECGAQLVLGQNRTPDTIEALKAVGCPVCSGRAFHRQAGRG
ncbi:MAG: bis-aminopropyl spermidine synthase family protein [Hyphomicrobiales bacterium]|nr:bis-aminopropyl spermidine synthase family protein [Hyphomicrobiales bacterium]